MYLKLYKIPAYETFISFYTNEKKIYTFPSFPNSHHYFSSSLFHSVREACYKQLRTSLFRYLQFSQHLTIDIVATSISVNFM